jgi:ATP-dependent DNA helicase RecG
MDHEEAIELVNAVRMGEFEDAYVEVKRAQRGLPQRLYRSFSAFANQTGGGAVVLGLDESRQFALTGVQDVQGVLTSLSDLAGKMQPPLALDTAVIEAEGQPAIVAVVPECDYRHKPCYYSPAGLQKGSYLRVGNVNRRMTEYEVLSFLSSQGQPTFDREPVLEAGMEDLNAGLLQAYWERLRQRRPAFWERLRLEEADLLQRLAAVRLVVSMNGVPHPTLAGLLMFGVWPQRYYPALVITFVRYYGTEAGVKGPRGERFLDNAKFEGPIPVTVEEAVRRVESNMRQSTLVEGLLHRVLLEYPEEALREAIVNAVAHRDYSPQALGSHIRLEMYADRLEVQSFGGLFGPVNEENLEETQSTRNQLLMQLLEDWGLVENRGSGIRAMVAAMRAARLEPPQFRDTRTFFRVTFKNQTLMDRETIAWLNRFANLAALNDNQRIALAYLRYNPQMTNRDYRRLNNVDTVRATRELRGLVDAGLVRMHASRRWAYYTLTRVIPTSLPPVAPDLVTMGLNERQVAALRYVQQHGEITTRTYVETIAPHITERMARKDLNVLQERGLVRRVGKTRGTKYVLPVPNSSE